MNRYRSMTVRELELPKRIINILTNAGIRTVRDLAHYSKRDLMREQRMGIRSCREVAAAMAGLGMRLRADRPRV